VKLRGWAGPLALLSTSLLSPLPPCCQWLHGKLRFIGFSWPPRPKLYPFLTGISVICSDAALAAEFM